MSLLSQMTWQEVERAWQHHPTIILPVGSTEQHGPMGLIGTDAICAEAIARRVGDLTSTIVAPTILYTPAPFNMGFAGTMSVSEATFTAVARDLLSGLSAQGVRFIYILNGHGANLDPLKAAIGAVPDSAIRLRSWWDFEPVNHLRRAWYGDWEGMHATPSEVAITQAVHRIVPPGDATSPPRRLSPAYIQAHAGDKHAGAEDHKAAFPDGRVGSHSALATPEQGAQLLDVAADAIASDFLSWSKCPGA